MNITQNRFVVFTAPVLWMFAAMITTRTIEQGVYTVWLGLSCIADAIHMDHRRYIIDVHQIHLYRLKLITQNMGMVFIAACGFPKLCLLSLPLVYLPPNKPLAVMTGSWFIWYLCSHAVDLKFPLDCHTRWYGALIGVWLITLLGQEKECKHLSKQSTDHQYRIIWTFRFLDQLILNALRWLVWCDCVFPYQTRWDMLNFSYLLTIVLMYITNVKKPQTNLVFTKPMKHIPAPNDENARECNRCRDSQKIVDVEHGFTL